MIPQTDNNRQDRYSVVVLDYPRREKQDIECYCIPSSNLDDHGYIPEQETVGDQRDDVGLGRPPLSPKKSQKGKRLWNRLKPRTKSIRNLGKPKSSRKLNSFAKTATKKPLTEAEMMQYISSQDDLDWSANEDKAANANPNRQPLSSIVEPLVQIQYPGGDDVDDTVSAISQDTCWQDDAQGVVELVLPNVLFCDDRDDDSEQKGIDNWNILFPSYIEECRENDRDEREDASRSGRGDAQTKEKSSERDDVSCKKMTSEDEASISSTGWEDTVSESESEDEKTKNATPQLVDDKDVKIVDTAIRPPSELDLSEKTIELEEEEEVEVQLKEPPKSSPPPELLLPSLAQGPVKDTKPSQDECSIAEKEVALEPKEQQALEQGSSNRLERSASAPLRGRKRLFSCAPLRRSVSGPRSKSPARSKSPRRRFLRRPLNKEPPSNEVQETLPKETVSEEKLNQITKESLSFMAPEPTTSAVKEIDVLSDGSLDSNLTNPSMFSSMQASPPPSPPKGWMRTQRRGSVTRFSVQQPALDLSPGTNASTRMHSIASVLSTAGSPMENSEQEDTLIDTSRNTGLLGGLWRKVLDIPSFLTRRKATKEEVSIAAGSATANDGDNADASWRSNSLGSLGGWSAFEDCEEGSNKWWEIGSSFLMDQVSCATSVPPAIAADTNTPQNDDETKSPMDDDDSFSSAPAAVFEDAAEDEIEVVSLSPKLQAQEEKSAADVDDAWSAAKRGDIIAIQKWTEDKAYDWTRVDDFGNTVLFYACHSGAAINITIVKVLLDQWPVDQIPDDVLDRCKLNAVNRSVVKMLEHPEKAEEIISAVFRGYLESNKEISDDDESYHLTKWLLYDVAEEEEEEEADY